MRRYLLRFAPGDNGHLNPTIALLFQFLLVATHSEYLVFQQFDKANQD
jgi:hypothetical protein